MTRKKVERRVKDTKRLTFDVPEEIHRKLKMRAVETGVPMVKLILEWIVAQLSVKR